MRKLREEAIRRMTLTAIKLIAEHGATQAIAGRCRP
jgi:hypothetical protein